MQAYRRNSPEAAARIVALALVSDGNVCRAEFEAVSHLGIETQLGLIEKVGLENYLQSQMDE